MVDQVSYGYFIGLRRAVYNILFFGGLFICVPHSLHFKLSVLIITSIAFDISLNFYFVFIKFVYYLFLFHTLHNYWLVHVNLKFNALLTGYYSSGGGGVYPLKVE